jgi:hypothetical protein
MQRSPETERAMDLVPTIKNGNADENTFEEAETDATKRILFTFGNLFSLALYDKDQRFVRPGRKRKRPRHLCHNCSGPYIPQNELMWVFMSSRPSSAAP